MPWQSQVKLNLFVHLDQGFTQGHVTMILVEFHKIYTYGNHIVAHTVCYFLLGDALCWKPKYVQEVYKLLRFVILGSSFQLS